MAAKGPAPSPTGGQGWPIELKVTDPQAARDLENLKDHSALFKARAERHGNACRCTLTGFDLKYAQQILSSILLRRLIERDRLPQEPVLLHDLNNDIPRIALKSDVIVKPPL